MRTKILYMVIATAVSLSASGCASGDSDTAGADEQVIGEILPQKLARPADRPKEDLQPSPADDATFGENLAHELRRKTLAMADASGEATAECPEDIGSTSGSQVSCTVTYEGLEVAWNVSIGDTSGWSDNVVEYTASPRTGVLTREGVARLLYGNHSDSIDYVLCNDIPEAVLVPLNTETDYTCELVPKDKEPIGLNESVRVTEAGPRVY
ncbi:hypothetical protein [Streptomyces sp. HB132]|uniref:hypothetical protein n=1 Tax=Streptomyces sp. HB132 TaxID=767388 RepID=UPI0019614121|nr:hypothetical protein [Streptomyces sp. HB132]MBM7442859.1 hypothetical protein [Streptomyces sp. HB132]